MGEKVVKRRLADGTVKEYRYPKQGRTPRILPRSLGALIQEYRQSPEFERLKPATKRTYLRAIGHMEPFYRVAITDLKRRHVVGLRDAHRNAPSIANQVVAVFSVLMTYAVHMEYRETNPAAKVPFLKGGEYSRWSDDQIAVALERFPERLRRALVIALYTGQRQGDVLAMKWSDYDGEGITVTQEKTGAPLWVPCHSALRAEIDAWMAAGRTSTTIVADSRGRPYRADSFATMFSAEVRKHPELHGLVFHGLRKTAAAKLAEAGCTTHEIASITGHRTLAMLQHYTVEAEQRQRASAAIVKLENARLENARKRRADD